ncbi:MAG: CHAT domain-containing protein [Acidimicrobiales bacterium]
MPISHDPPDVADDLGRAELALRLAESDPRQARALALGILAGAGQETTARCVAFRAATLACLQLGQLTEARRTVAEGIALARAALLPNQLAGLQATSALLWFHAEQPERAMSEIDAALGTSGGAESDVVAELYGQRAYLLFRLGRYEEGLLDSDSAISFLRMAPGDSAETIEARVLSNRALAHAYRGCYELATADLARSLELHRRGGAELLAAQVLHNLGFVATRLGDVPQALQHFDETLVAYVRLGLPIHDLMIDRGELLTMARLIPEARRAAAQAVEALERAGLTADVAEARLALGEACLADHDLPAAVAAAADAEEAFERQGRSSWAALARDVRERAHRADLVEPVAIFESAMRSLLALGTSGWHSRALEARVTAARSALAAGRGELALTALANTPESAPDAPAADRVLTIHARSLELLANGRPDDALEMLRGGLELAAAQASSLRAATGQGGHGSRVAAMAETGLGVVLAAGDGAAVLAWAELGRLARPPGPAVRASLAAGTWAGDLIGSLGDCVLVELVRYRDQLFGVVAAGGSLRLCELGPFEPVGRARAALRFAIGQLTAEHHSMAVRQAMAALLQRSVAALDGLLGAPLVATLELMGSFVNPWGADDLVIVAPGGLHDMAWGALCSLARFGITVVPSASAWFDRASSTCQPAGSGEVLLVAGPDLGAAGEELEALCSQCYPNRALSVLEGAAASRTRVLAGMSRAEIAHLAVHASFRADNPYMSSFHLYDGDLTVHEMAAFRPVPRPSCVVLSACDAGLAIAHPGEERTGPVPAILGFGTGHVIAAVAPLIDAVMPDVSVRLHRRLAAGTAPPVALREARHETGELFDLGCDELAAGGHSAGSVLAGACLVCHGGTGDLLGVTPLMLGESSL